VERDTYCVFNVFFITATVAMYSLEILQKVWFLSVTVIELNFLIFLITVTAVTVKSVTR